MGLKEHADRSYLGYKRKRENDIIRILVSETREKEPTLTKMKENVRKIGFDKGQEFGFRHVMFGMPISNL